MADYDAILRAMTDRFTELAGFSPDAASDIGIRMKVLAAQIFSLQSELESLREGLFPTTARAERLDLHAQTRGLVRKAALPSTGVLRFFRQTQAVYDILIPAGTVCQTEGGAVQAETTTECVLAAGQLYADAPAQSVQTGAGANVAADHVTVFATAPQGVYGVTNPAPFEGGQDAEGDEGLRERLLASYHTISNGTNAAFYYAEAMKHDFVYSASVLPRARGIGTVDVVAAGRGIPLAQQELDLIGEELARKKEICVDVAVRAPVLCPVDIAIALRPLDEYGFEGVQAAVEQHITEYIRDRKISEPLLLSQLSGSLCAMDGVYNFRVTNPAQDVAAEADELITLGELAVTRMS
ncbi:MAG: baseplate J/gp47 family protein [Acetanaerobacterium sp.]